MIHSLWKTVFKLCDLNRSQIAEVSESLDIRSKTKMVEGEGKVEMFNNSFCFLPGLELNTNCTFVLEAKLSKFCRVSAHSIIKAIITDFSASLG